jgi:putative ABC transport system permease protein
MPNKYKELAILSMRTTLRRRLRSSLTIIAVVIGIASVVALMLLSDGLFNAINSQFSSWGANTVFVMPSQMNQDPTSMGRVSQDTLLTMQDYKSLEGLPDVDIIVPFIISSTKVTHGNEDEFVQYISAPVDKMDDAFTLYSMNLREGRLFNGNEGHYVIIGSYIADELFKQKIKLGNKILINNIEFKVIGILEPIGNVDDDSTVYITRKSAEEISGFGDVVNYISIRSKPNTDVNAVKTKIENKLEVTHDKDTFTVITAEQMLDMVKTILNIMKIILTAIAGISIVVGAIGIANSVYTSVMERTREIGVLKSIGAKINDIIFIFVFESILLSFIGGVIGLGIGIGIAKAIEWYAKINAYDIFKIIVTPEIVITALLLAIFVGFIAGLLPAYKASKMNPVDALKENF